MFNQLMAGWANRVAPEIVMFAEEVFCESAQRYFETRNDNSTEFCCCCCSSGKIVSRSSEIVVGQTKFSITLMQYFLIMFLYKQTTIKILQQINVRNFHPVYGAGIRNHNLQKMCLLPKRLDQGSRPMQQFRGPVCANHPTALCSNPC